MTTETTGAKTMTNNFNAREWLGNLDEVRDDIKAARSIDALAAQYTRWAIDDGTLDGIDHTAALDTMRETLKTIGGDR